MNYKLIINIWKCGCQYNGFIYDISNDKKVLTCFKKERYSKAKPLHDILYYESIIQDKKNCLLNIKNDDKFIRSLSQCAMKGDIEIEYMIGGDEVSFNQFRDYCQSQ